MDDVSDGQILIGISCCLDFEMGLCRPKTLECCESKEFYPFSHNHGSEIWGPGR